MSDRETSRFCSGDGQTLSFYVNGIPYTSDLSGYIFEHNDRILVSFGNPKSIPDQIKFLESLEIFEIPKKIPRYSGDGITI